MDELKQYKNDFLSAYDLYADSIYRFCYFRISNKELAEDMVQEVFMRTWKYGTEGHEIKDVRAFLYQTARNMIIDHYRKSHTKMASLDTLSEEGVEFENGVEVDAQDVLVDKTYTFDKIKTDIQKLKDLHKEVVVLRYVEGLSVAEIAEILGQSENVVSVRIYRAIKELQGLVQDKNYEI